MTVDAEKTVDVTQATFVRGQSAEERGRTWLVLHYPARKGSDVYEIAGWSDVTQGTCTCRGYLFRQRCRHIAALPEFAAQFERDRVAKLSTDELLTNLRWYTTQDRLTHDERTALGAIRAVLARRGVRLAAAPAAVARGRAAVSELFEEGA